MKLCRLGIHKYKLLRIEKITVWDRKILKFREAREVYFQCKECGNLDTEIEDIKWTEEELKDKYKWNKL